MNNQNLNNETNKVQNELSTKKFEARNSILTDLFKNDHIRGIYYISWIVVVTSQLRLFLHNYITYGRVSFGLELFEMSFFKPLPLLYIWVCMFLTTFLPYFGFVLWATIRNKISKPSSTFFDQLSLITFVSFIAVYTYYFIFLIHQTDFKPVFAIALLFELVRLKMKLYAFVRSNVPRTMKFKYHNKDAILYPNLSKYVYFLFAPTLVYQDEYPRSKSIRWKKVAEHFINFAGTLLFVNVLIKYSANRFELFCQNPFTWGNFGVIVIEFIPISGLLKFTLFYVFLHCWSNAFAEMLQFSDRLFYKDFWTSKSPERYFRTWNTIVYDWLYVYIYKDFYEIIWPNNKFVGRVMVFFMSALYHEIILGTAINEYSLFVFFIFFVSSLFVKMISFNNALGNFFFLLYTGMGASLLVCGYGIQFYYKRGDSYKNIDCFDF